jgi:hypothetical protein
MFNLPILKSLAVHLGLRVYVKEMCLFLLKHFIYFQCFAECIFRKGNAVSTFNVISDNIMVVQKLFCFVFVHWCGFRCYANTLITSSLMKMKCIIEVEWLPIIKAVCLVLYLTLYRNISTCTESYLPTNALLYIIVY